MLISVSLALNNSMNSSLAPFGPLKRNSLITMPGPLCAETFSSIGDICTAITTKTATNHDRDLMTNLLVSTETVGGATIHGSRKRSANGRVGQMLCNPGA